ncbi:hypothetical protein F0562_017997 [Nyssa sinensis]|uniref:EF-hand domain-containing protein n=1 Tax=Nyssa sinensis TaxID=561372 RepID=A0A5J4ZB64_9ASTE|nr:hypothetical protein F0562_017997 [Nyssa sinensis]
MLRQASSAFQTASQGFIEKWTVKLSLQDYQIDGKHSNDTNCTIKLPQIEVQNLTPRELLALSVQLLAKGHKDRAIPLLRLALGKDPDYVEDLIVMGQTLLQNGLAIEANDYLERAISKSCMFERTKSHYYDALVLLDMFLALDKDMNGTLSKQELREYAEGTLFVIFIERGFAFVYMDDERDAEDAIRGLDRIEFGRKGQ